MRADSASSSKSPSFTVSPERDDLERAAIVTENFLPKPTWTQLGAFRRVWFPARDDEEQLFKMPGLPVIHDVKQSPVVTKVFSR